MYLAQRAQHVTSTYCGIFPFRSVFEYIMKVLVGKFEGTKIGLSIMVGCNLNPA